MNEKQENQFKICRACHVIYKSLDQKNCGNGCQFKEPYLINGEINDKIEPREVFLKKNVENIVRWVCLGCKTEYSSEQIELTPECSCGLKNEFYPFTEKVCVTPSCKVNSVPRSLSIEAKVCDLCGKANFLINQKRLASSLVPYHLTDGSTWGGPEKYEFQKNDTPTVKATNLPSLTFTLFNNNYQVKLYGESKEITLYELIHNSMGFIPDELYLKLIKEYGLYERLFLLTYEPEREQYTFTSHLPYFLTELDGRYSQKYPPIEQKAGGVIPLAENKLLALNANFFKIHIFVY